MATAPASTIGRRPNRSEAADQPMIPTMAQAEEMVSALSTVCREWPTCTP
jgi:hypothetical protein